MVAIPDHSIVARTSIQSNNVHNYRSINYSQRLIRPYNQIKILLIYFLIRYQFEFDFKKIENSLINEKER